MEGYHMADRKELSRLEITNDEVRRLMEEKYIVTGQTGLLTLMGPCIRLGNGELKQIYSNWDKQNAKTQVNLTEKAFRSLPIENVAYVYPGDGPVCVGIGQGSFQDKRLIIFASVPSSNAIGYIVWVADAPKTETPLRSE
jgi:hypothetical protein